MLAWMLWLVCGRREPVAVVWYLIDSDGHRLPVRWQTRRSA